MRAVSLFAGIGGFDLAAQRCSVDAAVQVEINAFCRRVLAKRFPRARRFKDVREVTGREIGTTDLLCGGFPCQDVSVAGKRAGLAGERTGLFWQIVRLADECRPRWLLLENVPGLLSSEGGRDFGAVLGALGELGYGYAWRVLDAQFFGVAQRRRRVFIVGCTRGAEYSAQVLFEPESCARHPASRREAGTRVAASLTRGTGRTSNDPGRRAEDDVNLALAATLNSGGNSGGFRTEPGEHLVSMPLLAKGNDSHAEDLQTYVPVSSPALLDSRAGYRSDLETEAFVTHALTGEGHDASEAGATKRDAVAGQAVGVRRLMPVECERLQGFPDGFTCLCGAADEYRAILWLVHEAARAEGLPGRQQRGVDSVCSEAILQLHLRTTISGEPRGGDPRFWTQACAEAFQANGLSALWDHREAAGPPSQRQRHAEQHARERDVPLRILSREGALGDWQLCSAGLPAAHRQAGWPWQDCLLTGLSSLCDCPDSPRYRALGNAVCVNVVQWILQRLVAVDAASLEQAA